jgi:histidinol-phosphate/aromatic aminotransferase/cobyric acid decarboxylase-like protein
MMGYKFPDHVRVTVGTMAENQKLIGALERLLEGHSTDLATVQS